MDEESKEYEKYPLNQEEEDAEWSEGWLLVSHYGEIGESVWHVHYKIRDTYFVVKSFGVPDKHWKTWSGMMYYTQLGALEGSAKGFQRSMDLARERMDAIQEEILALKES